jgi:predicted peptidase
MKPLFTCLLILSSMATLKTQPTAALLAFEAATFVSTKGDTLPYRVLWPKGYRDADDAKRYPLVFFLHGAGERGHDNQLQLTHGTPLFLAAQEDYPAIVIMPQCSADDYWAQMIKTTNGKREYNFNETPNSGLGAVSYLIDHLLITEKADPERVYLMGLSMGAMGAFELLARRPNTFAGAITICGGSNPALTPIYANQVALWIFHGENDQVVKVEQSRRMVEALKNLGAECKYTEYPGVGHNSWDNAFAEPGLLEWLFAQRRE